MLYYNQEKEREEHKMFKLIYTEKKEEKIIEFKEYWQALTTGIRLQNMGVEVRIEKKN